MGNASFDLCMKRTPESYFFTFTPQGTSQIYVEFSPTFPAGTRFSNIRKDGNETQFTSFNDQKHVSFVASIKLSEPCQFQIDYDDGIEVLPALSDPTPGSAPEGLRIISSRLIGNRYLISVEGERKTSSNIDVYINNQEIDKIENGIFTSIDGTINHIKVDFDPGDSKYQNKTVIIYLKQKPGPNEIIPVQKKEKKEKKVNSPKCPRWY